MRGAHKLERAEVRTGHNIEDSELVDDSLSREGRG